MRFDIVLEDESAEGARRFVLGGEFSQDEGQIVIEVRERIELLELGLDGSLGFRVGRLRFLQELNDLMQPLFFGMPGGRRGRSRRRGRHIVRDARD